MNNKPNALAVTVRDAADMTSFSLHTIYQAINKGELPARRNGQQFRIKVSDLEEWFDSLPAATDET